MSLSTIETDAEAVAKKIEDFFESLIPHIHPDNHAKLEAAKTAAVAATVTPPAPVAATPATPTTAA